MTFELAALMVCIVVLGYCIGHSLTRQRPTLEDYVERERRWPYRRLHHRRGES